VPSTWRVRNSDDGCGPAAHHTAVKRTWLVVIALVLAACGAAPSARVPLPAPDESAPPSSAPSAEPLASPGPTLAPTATASPVPLPVGGRVSSAQADFDCDGRADRLEFYARADVVRGEQPFVARLSLANGATSEVLLDGFSDLTPLIGTTDVNGDRCDDAIVTVGHGASTTWTTFLVYDGADLRRVEEDGKPVMFLFGGSVRHGNAIECRTTKDASEIIARAASDYTSELQWDTVEDVHRWSTKTHLVLWSTTRSVIAVRDRYAMPANQEKYWGLSCGNVKFPG
jgi:hypothetical protein